MSVVPRALDAARSRDDFGRWSRAAASAQRSAVCDAARAGRERDRGQDRGRRSGRDDRGWAQSQAGHPLPAQAAPAWKPGTSCAPSANPGSPSTPIAPSTSSPRLQSSTETASRNGHSCTSSKSDSQFADTDSAEPATDHGSTDSSRWQTMRRNCSPRLPKITIYGWSTKCRAALRGDLPGFPVRLKIKFLNCLDQLEIQRTPDGNDPSSGGTGAPPTPLT